MDFGWFVTIPGMLITGGVLLLIIALIIFITTSGKKNKKEAKDNNVQQGNNNSTTDMEVAPLANSQPGEIETNSPSITANPVGVGENINSVEQANVALTDGNVNMDSISPVENNLQSQPSIASSAPVDTEQSVSIEQVEPTTPVVESQSIGQEEISPIADPMTASTLNVTPVADSVVTPTPEVAPVMNNPVTPAPEVAPVAESAIMTAPEVTPVADMPVTPAPEATPVVDSSVAPTQEVSSTIETPVVQSVNTNPIYGGADPTVATIDDSQNSNHQIYGGANPLENTQVIPVQTQEAVAPVSPTPAVVPSVESAPVQAEIGNSNISNQNG